MPISESVDRSVSGFISFEDSEAEEVDYWLSKTPTERIELIEYLRRWYYGNAAVDARLQRVFAFVKLGED